MHAAMTSSNIALTPIVPQHVLATVSRFVIELCFPTDCHSFRQVNDKVGFGPFEVIVNFNFRVTKFENAGQTSEPPIN